MKDKKVINLTKQDISIVDYKKALAKRSTFHFPFCLIKLSTNSTLTGQAQIEKAKLISKSATKGVA